MAGVESRYIADEFTPIAAALQQTVSNPVTNTSTKSKVNNVDLLTVDFMLPNTIIKNRYDLIHRMDVESGNGQLYYGVDLQTKQPIVVKFEPENANVRTIIPELTALTELKHQGVNRVCLPLGDGKVIINNPEVPDNLRGCYLFFIILPFAGKSVRQLLLSMPGHKFTVATALKLYIEQIKCIHEVHKAGWLHRDIQPGNFLVDKNEGGGWSIKLIDFSYARRWRNIVTGLHEKERPPRGFYGTNSHASLRSAKYKDLSRIDDLWSLFFCACEYFVGADQLPWSPNKLTDFYNLDAHDQRVLVGRAKSHMVAQLLRYYPQLLRVYRYLKSVTFEQEPDYYLLQSILIDELAKIGIIDPRHVHYDWDENRN